MRYNDLVFSENSSNLKSNICKLQKEELALTPNTMGRKGNALSRVAYGKRR